MKRPNWFDRIDKWFRARDERTWLSHLLIGTGGMIVIRFFGLFGAALAGTVWAVRREYKNLQAGGSVTDSIGDILGYLVGIWGTYFYVIPLMERWFA